MARDVPPHAAWLLPALLTPIAALLLERTLSGAGFAASRPELLQAAALLVAGQLLLAVPAAATRSILTSALAAVYLGALCPVLLWSAAPVPALRLATGVAVLAFFLNGCTRLLGTPAANLWVLMAGLVASATPLWAGPLAELPGTGPSLADTLLAVSPFTWLAALADWDFLRHDWFYRHTPLGTLRFRYPDAVTAGSVYLGLALFCHGAAHLLHGRRYADTADPLSLDHTEGVRRK